MLQFHFNAAAAASSISYFFFLFLGSQFSRLIVMDEETFRT